MNIQEAVFIQSNTDYQKCPKPDKPEYAFIGRSNVGKSSLINTLTLRHDLAKTSQTPGKTQLINHFLINQSWYLVDLPGYGYAKVSKTERAKFEKMISEYLIHRENLICTFVLIDIRHDAQRIDLEFIEQLGQNQVPFQLVFTKADKLSTTKIQQHVTAYTAKLLETWEECPHYFVSSSVNKQGRDELLSAIEKMNLLFQP